MISKSSEVEFSRTHFEVLGFEVSSPRKLACPRLEDSTIFWMVKNRLENASNFGENLRRSFFSQFSWDRMKHFFENLFFWTAWKIFWRPFFMEITWALSSRRLFLASEFFYVLGLERCVLDSTSVNRCTIMRATSVRCIFFSLWSHEN